MKQRLVVVLDNIRSAHNVGSIFRTADAAGCVKLYLCGITPGPLDRFGRPNIRLTKVSLGAERSVTWEHAPSTADLLARLKQNGYQILALEQHQKAVSIYDLRLSWSHRAPYALVVGQEVEGISSEVLHMSDKILEIPMRGKKESLNVSVAFGVAVFQLLR